MQENDYGGKDLSNRAAKSYTTHTNYLTVASNSNDLFISFCSVFFLVPFDFHVNDESNGAYCMWGTGGWQTHSCKHGDSLLVYNEITFRVVVIA